MEADKKAKEAKAKDDQKRAQREKDLKKTMVEPRIVTQFDDGKKGGNVAKLRMLKSYIETMEQSGMTKNQVQNTLKKEEKELLEEEQFVEARKKQYGRI